MENESDYYAILGVSPQASQEVVRNAFARLLDKFPENDRKPSSNQAYKQVLQAYEVLSDPKRRAVYDSLMEDFQPGSLAMNVLASRNAVSLTESVQLLYLLVTINQASQEQNVHLPLNVSLVIDRSTSMRGDRLNRVKTAVSHIIDMLGDTDVLSVVGFSDRAEVVVPAGTIQNKQITAGKIQGLDAAGGTEIYQGLAAGLKEIQKSPLARHTNHLILLTDGHTYGDSEDCLQLAQTAARQGIGFSAFGIGAEWNDQFIDRLVAASAGQSGFIQDAKDIVKYLQQRIKGLGEIHATDIRLNTQFPKEISVNYAFKLAPFAQPLQIQDSWMHIGNLEGRTSLKLLLELQVPPQVIETRLSIPIQLTAKIPAQQMHEQTIKETIQLLVLADLPEESVPKEIVNAVKLLSMYRLNEKALTEVDAGELERATTRMHYLTTRLLAAGQTQLAQQAHAESVRLQNMEGMSEEGRKRLKYGTRAMLTQVLEDDSSE